jgi:hypothetical protein
MRNEKSRCRIGVKFSLSLMGVALLGLPGIALGAPKKANTPPPVKPAPTALEAREVCLSAKEYITTLEYLRDQPDLKVPDPEAQKVAERVARGCKGSAQRFIQVTSAVSKAGLTGKDAVTEGLGFSSRTDAETRAFLTAFKMGFLEEGLDLEVRGALALAHSLSTEFNGESEHARRDFERLVRFCVTQEGLDLPKPLCGKFSARVARLGEPFERGVSESFMTTFRFLTSRDQGPRLTTAEALRLAESLTAAGPGSAENFIQAFNYGQAGKGLKLDIQQAVSFAKRLNEYQTPLLESSANKGSRQIASEKK